MTELLFHCEIVSHLSWFYRIVSLKSCQKHNVQHMEVDRMVKGVDIDGDFRKGNRQYSVQYSNLLYFTSLSDITIT